jgi:hypothetical protein
LYEKMAVLKVIGAGSKPVEMSKKNPFCRRGN